MTNRRRQFILLVLFSGIGIITAFSGENPDVLWRYGRDRYGRPALTERLDVPPGMDPYRRLAEYRGFQGWITRRDGNIVILAERASEGEVPILCLHKISREEYYGLTPQRFRRLLNYINDKGWYLIADHHYLDGDFSRVPTGLKPIVMGSDDASHGTLIYQTRGNRLTGEVKRFFGKPLTERDSMVAILERYAKKEEGRINFTFYVSFDAVPFRQLDGHENPGFPYPGIPVVAEKIRYLDENFILGIHSLSHIYARNMGPADFARDVLEAWTMIDEYAGGEAATVRTLAFPYGIGTLTSDFKDALSTLSRNGKRLTGAFDFDNRMAPAPGASVDKFDVSRLNADNRNWDRLMQILENADAVVARREIVWETDIKRLPRSRWALGAQPSDGVWILVRGSSETDKAE